MSEHDRRTFLKAGAAALSAAALGGCDPRIGRDGSRPTLDAELLRSVAAVALPTEVGDQGMEDAARGFERWLNGFEPVAEQNHGYGTHRVEYGPPDPAPRWAAQLRALDLEARRRHDEGFASLSTDRRRTILRRQIDDEGPGVPAAVRARHVAVGLLAWWLETPEATDRCYGARIRTRSCRGLSETTERPEPLTVSDLG